jgi:hypothetical protein
MVAKTYAAKVTLSGDDSDTDTSADLDSSVDSHIDSETGPT